MFRFDKTARYFKLTMQHIVRLLICIVKDDSFIKQFFFITEIKNNGIQIDEKAQKMIDIIYYNAGKS